MALFAFLVGLFAWSRPAVGSGELYPYGFSTLVRFSEEGGEEKRNIVRMIYKSQIDEAARQYPQKEVKIAIGELGNLVSFAAWFVDHPYFCEGGNCKLISLIKPGDEWIEVLNTVSNGIISYVDMGRKEGMSLFEVKVLCIEATDRSMTFVWVPHRYKLHGTSGPGNCALRR